VNRAKRHVSTAVLTLVVLLTAESAWACPMCKAAAEADPRLPRAFMASILFMLGMPFTLLTCFGVGFYRLSKRRPQDDAAEAAIDSSASSGTA
jgi:hypothetical protein